MNTKTVKDISTITCRVCKYKLEIETPLYISTDMTTTCTQCLLKEMNMTIKEKINEAIRENLEAEGYSLSSEDWMVSTDKILSLIQKRLLKAIDMHLYGSTWSNHYLEAMNKTRSIIKFELSSNLESK